MSRRYLFGPVSAEFAKGHLSEARQDGTCLTFNADGTADLTIASTDTWEAVTQRLPQGWAPDFLVLHFAFGVIPPCVWSAPLPLVGLAGDWHLAWHALRLYLPLCEVVFTDTVGAEVMHRAGIPYARVASLGASDPSIAVQPELDQPRDIDVLYAGSMLPGMEPQLGPWLWRLAALSGRWRVALHSHVPGMGYGELVRRARIVFVRSHHGECPRLALDAAAAGALLLHEAGNRDLPSYLRARQECVYYTEEDLEELLERYLLHEEERQQIAAAGQARVRECSFPSLWQQALRVVEEEWATLEERRRYRLFLTPEEDVRARLWQALSSREVDPTFVSDIAAALAVEPQTAELHSALGLAVTIAAQGSGPTTAPLAKQAAGYFQRAVASEPAHIVAGLNLVEALVGIERYAEATECAQRTLQVLEQQDRFPPHLLDAGHFPPQFDLFRLEWEKAAWSNAGDFAAEGKAKRELVRSRLHTLLAQLTGQLTHYHEALLACPDLTASGAALGMALERSGQATDAIVHLRRAVREDPFNRAAALALFQALGKAGDGIGQRRLAEEQRWLAQAAPLDVPVEPWIVKVPPVGDELASLLILCCNEVAYTRLCLESVLRHTRPPYELILVDNGSTDATPQYLEEISRRTGPARVVVIRNETNQGFAAGCNQAITQARGRYLVLLNNDTVVTPGWLQGLIAWSLHDWPQVALVGAVSNYAPPPQYVPAGYSELSHLDAFAAHHRQQHAAKATRVERLTGFCLLLRREVLQRIGDFDERFGVGFFEDDDLCVRAREAGFQLLVAQEVYVHHFGSRTFQALGIDCQEQLESNFAQFKGKWGEERAAGYQLLGQVHQAKGHPAVPIPAPAANGEGVVPGGEGAPAPRGHGRLTVSLCLIVKNEEENLPSCLLSVADLADEIIVVDTGSTDATKEVARQFGAKVFDFPWINDFAAARNACLEHATGDWIFWMDADDRLDEANREKLRQLFASLKDENVGYVMKCLCLPDLQTGTATEVDHVRLFRNHPEIRWQYRVHEQILPAVKRLGGSIRPTDVVIQHVGYLDPALRARKQQRDIQILEQDLAEHPDDPFILFNLGWVYEEMGRPLEALPLLQRSLERSHPSDSIVRKLFALILACYEQLGQLDRALAVCREGRRYYPEDAQLLFQEAALCKLQGDVAGAEACWLQLLQTTETPHFASVATGLRSFKTRHELARLYVEQGRPAEAEAQWQAALQEHPEFVPGWIGLGELYLHQGRWQELEGVTERLETALATPVAAIVLRAREQMARKEYAAALQMLDGALEGWPHDTMLLRIRSYALLQEGKDWAAAEQALQRLLEVDPSDREAQNNLAVLQRQHPQTS